MHKMITLGFRIKTVYPLVMEKDSVSADDLEALARFLTDHKGSQESSNPSLLDESSIELSQDEPMNKASCSPVSTAQVFERKGDTDYYSEKQAIAKDSAMLHTPMAKTGLKDTHTSMAKTGLKDTHTPMAKSGLKDTHTPMAKTGFKDKPPDTNVTRKGLFAATKTQSSWKCWSECHINCNLEGVKHYAIKKEGLWEKSDIINTFNFPHTYGLQSKSKCKGRRYKGKPGGIKKIFYMFLDM